jgi:hypothetical protein
MPVFGCGVSRFWSSNQGRDFFSQIVCLILPPYL